MVVEAFDNGGGLLEADVVKAGERGATDVFDCVVGDQKMLLCEKTSDLEVTNIFQLMTSY